MQTTYSKEFNYIYPVIFNERVKFFVKDHKIISYDKNTVLNEDKLTGKEKFKICDIGKQVGTASIFKIVKTPSEAEQQGGLPVHCKMKGKYFTKSNTSSHMYVSSPWNPFPTKGKLKILDSSNLTYKKIVSEQLKIQKGLNISQSKVQISQIWSIDLDNDGKDEVLISSGSKSGYSMVLCRKIVKGKVKNTFLEFDKNKDSYSAVLNVILNVIDINGDGKMEVITNSQRVEGGTYNIYSVDNGLRKWLGTFGQF